MRQVSSAPLAMAMPGGDSTGPASVIAMIVAPDSLRTDQDSDGGEGRQCPSPLSNGNLSCTGLPLGGLATSCLIREPLPFDAIERTLRAAAVVNAEFFPVVISEIELGEIPPQMFLRHVLVNAVNAAFEDREKPFDGIGVNRAAHILLLLMLDGAVRSEVMADVGIDRMLVAHEAAFALDVARHDAPQTVCRDRRDVEGAHLALALDQRKHRHFVGWRQEGFARRLAAHVGFVNLDGDASATKPIRENAAIFGHGLADTMSGEPSGFHAAIEHALDLPGRDALLAATKQVNDLEPQVERQVAILENRPDPYREVLLTGVALVEADPRRLAVQPANPGSLATMRANRAVGPQVRFDVSEGGDFIFEMMGVENRVGHGEISYGPNTTLWGSVCQV